MPTVQELADKASSAFELAKRDDGTEYWKLKDNAPDWLTAAVREAHGEMLPDDHKYRFVYQALNHMSDIDELDEPQLEADVYNHDLTDWLSSHLERVGYVDEAVEEYGHSADMGVIGDIQMGQVKEMDEVYWSMLNALREQAGDEDEDVEDNPPGDEDEIEEYEEGEG